MRNFQILTMTQFSPENCTNILFEEADFVKRFGFNVFVNVALTSYLDHPPWQLALNKELFQNCMWDGANCLVYARRPGTGSRPYF